MSLFFSHLGARAVRQENWKIVWAKRMPYQIDWELYNLAGDRCETHTLATQYPENVNEFSGLWWEYQERTGLNIPRGSMSDW